MDEVQLRFSFSVEISNYYKFCSKDFSSPIDRFNDGAIRTRVIETFPGMQTDLATLKSSGDHRYGGGDGESMPLD